MVARDGYVIETLAGIDARGRDSITGDIWTATMVRLHGTWYCRDVLEDDNIRDTPAYGIRGSVPLGRDSMIAVGRTSECG